MKDTLKAIKRYKNILAEIAELEAKKDSLKAEIISAMDGQEKITVKVNGVTVTVTNKPIASTRVDTAKVKAAFPDWVDRFGTTSVSPRFTVK